MDRVLLALAADRLLFPPWRAENRVESTVESIGLEPSDLPWFTSPSSVPPPLLRPASGCCCSAGHGATTPSVLSWSTVSCSPAAGSGSLGDQNSWPRAASGQSASSPPRQLQRYSYLQLTNIRPAFPAWELRRTHRAIVRSTYSRTNPTRLCHHPVDGSGPRLRTRIAERLQGTRILRTPATYCPSMSIARAFIKYQRLLFSSASARVR